MTDASRQALQGMRDFTMLEWYVIPLLAGLQLLWKVKFLNIPPRLVSH